MNSMMNDEAFLKQAGDKAGAFVASLAGATGKVLAKCESCNTLSIYSTYKKKVSWF